MTKTLDLFSCQNFLQQTLALLEPSAAQELCKYAEYLLLKQQQNDVRKIIFQNQKLLHMLQELIEHPHLAPETAAHIQSFKHHYYELLQTIYEKYAVLSPTPDFFCMAREVGTTAFESITQALWAQDAESLAFELRELQQVLQQLA